MKMMYAVYLGLGIVALLSESHLAKVGPPVILVPGLSDSQLDAKVDNGQFSQDCSSIGNGYVNMWMNFSVMLNPALLNCFNDTLSFQYDKSTLVKSADGVQVRVDGFGNTTSVEWLSPSVQNDRSMYYSALVEKLVSNGYVRGVSVLGAPYDFRKSPGELADYFQQLKNLVETAYNNNGKKRVMFVAHSMGCLLVNYFLHQQSGSWKKMYVQSLVALAGPWGGAFESVGGIVTGLNEGFGTLLFIRGLLRTWPSVYYFLPTSIGWSRTDKLVVTPKRSYSIQDYSDLLKDMNYAEGQQNLNAIQRLPDTFSAPGVDFYCIHGKGVNTTGSIRYNTIAAFPDTPSELTNEDGDGTGRLQSLLACDKFKFGQRIRFKKFEHIIIPGMEHQSTVYNAQVINYILTITSSN